MLRKGVKLLIKKMVDYKKALVAILENTLEKEVAVLRATRPYQDALIQAAIARVAEQAEFNLFRRTCRMISGEVVLPNTPTVTGYGSYDPCACRATTPAPSAN